MKLGTKVVDNLLDAYTDQLIHLWEGLDPREEYMFAAKGTSLALSFFRDLEEMESRGWLEPEEASSVKADLEKWLADYFQAWEEGELER